MADGTDWERLDDALDRAFDLEGDDREAFLLDLDPDLRSSVQRALEEDSILDRPGDARAALEGAEETTVAEGVRIGPYEIISLVGEGGMGRVYRARRADGAFDRTVALKLVRQSLALAGSDVFARLKRERDLLAALDHPHIARLVDGGETEDGVPYLVTDFVDGESITAYAERRELSVAERVRLVIEAARAVDHAHRRFVVHRDLKPGNILVAEADGEAHPMVLDFGIAKLLDEAEGDGTGALPLTQTGVRLLTPAYAAPELYDPALGVTAAADVYGLGAILYELLTGTRARGNTSSAPTEAPTRPSRAVPETGETAQDHARAASRVRALRGDLDVICLKALHLNPARRYGSAAELADDLQRYLDGRPVEARPDSAWYVASRFARRNRALVGTAGVALVALLVTLGFLANALVSEQESRAEAERAAARAAEAADLLAGVFSAARGGGSPREALDAGLQRISTMESPELQGYLLTVIGRAYNDLGEHYTADSLMALAVEALDTPHADPNLRANALIHRASTQGFLNRRETGRRYALQAAAIQRAHPIDRRIAFDIARHLSWLQRTRGHTAEGVEWAEQAARLAEEIDATPGQRWSVLWELSTSYSTVGRHGEAVDAIREAYDLARAATGPTTPFTLNTRAQVARVLATAGRQDEAARICQALIPEVQRASDSGSERLEKAYWCLEQSALRLGRSGPSLQPPDGSATPARAGLGTGAVLGG